MADLPMERVSANPPCTYVGVDLFGPWTISYTLVLLASSAVLLVVVIGTVYVFA